MPPLRFARLSLVPMVALLWSRRCPAQVDHAAARRLGSTTFLLPALEDSAFVLTEFGIRQGITYQQIPKFPVGSFLQYRLAWVSFDERIDLGLRIFDWLGVYAEGRGAAAI